VARPPVELLPAAQLAQLLPDKIWPAGQLQTWPAAQVQLLSPLDETLPVAQLLQLLSPLDEN
jgi:hypothetical protein